MIRAAVFLAMIAAPAWAEDLPKSEAATAFMQRCLTDVSDHRIATLKRQMPDYAASLSDEDLLAGGMAKAQKACPCFLQIAAINPDIEETDPEVRVGALVAYLDGQHAGQTSPMPPVIARLTRMCGERASILPPLWAAQ